MKKLFIGITILLLVINLGLIFSGRLDQAGPFMIAFWISLAIVCNSYSGTKGYVYTLMIFSAVTAALFYPQPFVKPNGWDLSKLITPLLQLIMFGMGTSMSARDFYGVVKMPTGVVIGLLCQFTIMPFMALLLTKVFSFAPEIAESPSPTSPAPAWAA